MVRTIGGLTQTVLEHKARAPDGCKEKRKSTWLKSTQAVFSCYLWHTNTSAIVFQQGNPSQRTAFTVTNPPEQATQCLAPLSLSLLNLQTCSHPKLYFSLTRREATAVRRTELSSTVRVAFFRQSFDLPLPTPPGSL